VEQPVLIVGAGPVGLTAALSLAQQGVPCRIVDRLPQRINQSRAAIIHSRTMELLERLGVVAGFLEAGIRVHGINVMDKDGRILLRNMLDDLPTAYNFLIGLGQDETERLLTEELARHGLAVERPTTLTALEQTGDAVTATLTHGDGREERVVTPYLIGCDGSRSTVRHQLNLTLEGETLDVYWVTADVMMECAYPRDELVAVPGEGQGGFGFASPLPHGRWRVVVDMGEKPAVIPNEVSLAEVQHACDRTGLRVKLSDPTWISPFGVNTRMAPTMQVGRVFLAGDASHVHSPVGGQGMNTGMQDAINLAWKVALMVKGQGTEALLDSYNAERHANARRLLGFVGPATKMVNLRHPVAIALRRLVMTAVSQLGLTSLAARRASEIDIQYRHSPVVGEHHQPIADRLRVHDPALHPSLFDCWDFGKGPHPGERAPDAHGLSAPSTEPARLYQDWSGDHRHQLLVFTGRHPSPDRVTALASLAREAAASSPDLIRSRLIIPADIPIPDDVNKNLVLVDHDGDAHPLYGARYECLYLVRPDSYIGFRSQPAEAGPLREYLGRIFKGV
jgi:2-polyprenyl-6-methoxyphenol hydroxylase-like FAD-dependent oxidoreductase